MAQNKTVPTGASVAHYIHQIDNPQRKEDCITILELMKEATGEEPKMWGSSIVGFGSYHYKYESGREGDMILTGFSNRKQNITIYIMSGFKKYDDLLVKVGKFKTGKSCFYIKRLSDIDIEILKKMIKLSVEEVNNRYK